MSAINTTEEKLADKSQETLVPSEHQNGDVKLDTNLLLEIGFGLYDSVNAAISKAATINDKKQDNKQPI